MLHIPLLISLLVGSTYVAAAATSVYKHGTTNCPCGYYIPETKLIFTNRNTLDASTITATDNLQSALAKQGFQVDVFALEPSIYQTRNFTAQNVIYNSQRGSIDLIVTGNKKPKSQKYIRSGEISSIIDSVRYASVRYTARLDSTPGACHGFFFYMNDTAEVDMEVTTRYMYGTSAKVGAGHPRGLQCSIQGTDKQTAAISFQKHFDPTLKFHSYRFDWQDGKVLYYIDGKLWNEFDGFTPGSAWGNGVGGRIYVNNWSNGNPYWTGDAPLVDNHLSISKIDAYFNVTDSKMNKSSAKACRATKDKRLCWVSK